MAEAADGATAWRALGEEFDRWASGGLTARLWLRDDDAVEPTPALEQLTGLTLRFEIPLVLAVIPARSGRDLAQWLAPLAHVHPAVHGWSHQNHAPAGEKRQELGPHRPRQAVLEELARGLERLRGFHGERLIPMLVPPWNRIDAGIVADLRQLGFTALSLFGREPEAAPIAVVNTHVDLIDSRAGGRRREATVLIATLAGELARARLGGKQPVGVLSHHLSGDGTALDFLERLFGVTVGHPACRWQSPAELLG
ncbi:MAG: polysaccharide deacetylase family protein [Actinomycetota bacterium]|nr:polysaccharide deacetylase family protein [Actinomycetota bacterium]